MAHWVGSLAASSLESLLRKRRSGGSSFGTVAGSVMRYPIKAVAAFFTAPFLAFRVARVAKNPIRRLIAGVGLFIAMLAGWFAGTALGTAAGALLVMSKVGLFWGLAFLIGTTLSVVLSVVFSFLVLNATAFLFLHMSSEEVVEYLRTLSE